MLRIVYQRRTYICCLPVNRSRVACSHTGSRARNNRCLPRDWPARRICASLTQHASRHDDLNSMLSRLSLSDMVGAFFSNFPQQGPQTMVIDQSIILIDEVPWHGPTARTSTITTPSCLQVQRYVITHGTYRVVVSELDHGGLCISAQDRRTSCYVFGPRCSPCIMI